MRTRKANKTKSFSYADTYGIGSDEDADAPLEVPDADGDVDFDANQAEEGQNGSGDDEEEEEGLNGEGGEDGELSADEKPEDAVDDDEEVIAVESEDDDAADITSKAKKVPRGRGGWKKKLLKRATVHGVPPYPTNLQQTRVYDGPLKRWTRSTQLLNILYGPELAHIKVIRSMARKWFNSQVLPSRSYTGEGAVMESPWLAENYEAEQKQWSKIWCCAAAKGGLQQSRKIRSEHVDMFKPPQDDMICSLGPFNKQRQVRTRYGFGQPVLETGEPSEAVDPDLHKAIPPRGWLLDTGGLPLGIGWAPVSGSKEQFLAVCTVPYSDQESNYAEDAPDEDPEGMKRGSIQIWSIPCHKDDSTHARLVHHLWFDWGRPKRLQWCPVPSPDDSKIGMLAVLCADGQVRVFEVPKPVSSQVNYEWMTSPIAALGFTDEYMVLATSLTWVSTNRLCLGHTDGSISLWSIYPRKMLLRKSIHISYILDVASGFPSHPYHIASTPVGGCPTLTDLNLPSAETTYTPIVGAVNFQNNLVDWNDHLQGFFGMHPSHTPQSTLIGWAHVRFFVQSRTLMTTPSPPMCLASGKTHPFVLVGCADGSLWAMNPLRVLLRDKSDPIYKLKIMQHEFRPMAKLNISLQPGETLRGAARILQGFLPEMNSNPRADRPEADEEEEDNDDGLSKGEGKALAKELDRTRSIVHEARTRVVVTAWNPNVEYGWWAAAAMGSGLVKIMDLGVEDLSSEQA
ncbi:Transcription factor tau subunit sfc6 [Cytospora mali]|uniref:Transcription factor tau subunit sfc6 n=1 Tax=Cytospora mali TaxID=578113 RepID=A0A194VWS9_CYTMA|nr:Transcription factor tau subunit sfc6 [Valsa mali]